ncbi:MAG: ABC transporter substrate-binding protein [Bacteroidetes bacterium]|nr:ABC transporter substrate-binding protein [Bacteroidota bacterium]
MNNRSIVIGHSPDADDAYMFYGLTTGKVTIEGISIHHILQDIQTLNQRALNRELDVTAISAHAYAYVAPYYWIMKTGASMGQGYGPILISKEYKTLEELRGKTIATPGALTTATLLFHLFTEGIHNVDIPFDEIMARVEHGEFAAGIIIHEGQLTYRDKGFTKVVDFGELWQQRFGDLPLPLGINVIRKDVGKELAQKISNALYESIRYAFNHHDETLAYSLQFGRGITTSFGSRFITMYVNDITLNMEDRGKLALQTLYTAAAQKHLLPRVPDLELV